MMKRIVLGVLALVVIAIAVIAAAWVKFDIPREELVAKYASDASQFIELPSGAVAHVRDCFLEPSDFFLEELRLGFRVNGYH